MLITSQKLRRAFRTYTTDLGTLSPAERSVLGMDAPRRSESKGISESLRDPDKKRPT